MKVILKHLELFLLYTGVLCIAGCGQKIETYDAPPAIMFQKFQGLGISLRFIRYWVNGLMF